MIPMPKCLDSVSFLTGSAEMVENLAAVPALPAWSDRAVSFFGAFSRNLMKDARTRAFPDISSYAFWIRSASLRQIKDHYYAHAEGKVGRGVALHFAPSNVPVNFAVSFTSSLLAGNMNIVRLSSKPFEQADIVVDCLKKTFREGYPDMERYLILLRYEHNDAVTQYLSSLCDVRIIWGGDRTIETVRSAKLPPRSIELTFADRHSAALMNADAVVEADIKKLAEGFYTDTYYMDQNACSSPRIVVWFGKRIPEAKARFWGEVEKLVDADYAVRDIQAVDKLDSLCLLAASGAEAHLVSRSNKVMRIEIGRLSAELMKYKLGGGYFFEYTAGGLSELVPILGKPCQTLSYYGMDAHELQRFIIDHGLRGCDRIVPVGKTMDLTFKWDGFDMIETMSRYVYCPEYRTPAQAGAVHTKNDDQ